MLLPALSGPAQTQDSAQVNHAAWFRQPDQGNTSETGKTIHSRGETVFKISSTFKCGIINGFPTIRLTR